MLRYGILFEVEVAHDHFLSLGPRVHEALDGEAARSLLSDYAIAGVLGIAPTAETRPLLAGHRMIFKATRRGFRVGVQLDAEAADDRPVVPLASDLRLRFALTTGDATFHNYTGLAEAAPGFYRFGNDTANEVAGLRFLSLPVPAFDAARAYEAGEVRAEPSGGVIDLLQAVRDTGPTPAPLPEDWSRIPPDTFDATAVYTIGDVVLFENELFRALVDGPGTDLTNAGDWEPLGFLANQYVTRADGRVGRPSLFDLDLTSAALPTATIRLTRPGEATPAWERGYTAESGNLESVQLDLRAVEPGAYRLDVLDATSAPVPALGEDLYLDDEAVRQPWFGVVEIGAGAGGFALLDAGGALRSPSYSLRFLNRASRWRYIFPSPQATGVGSEVVQEGSDAHVLVTPDPRPLTRFGSGVRLQDDVLPVLLPEPGVASIRRQAGQWFSEIHASNLTLTP